MTVTAIPQNQNKNQGRKADAVFQAEDLRYWLANEDWYMSRYTRNWLDRTPPALAADILAHIAEDAQPEPTSLLQRTLILLAYSGFATSTGIAGSGPGDRKAGTRAALLLAKLGDERCIAPLARVFQPYGFWKSKYQQDIEEALAHYLEDAVEQGQEPTQLRRHAAEVRQLVERAWLPGLRRRDLTPSLTNFVLAAVRYLRAAGGVESVALLREIAETPVEDRLANRIRIKRASSQA